MLRVNYNYSNHQNAQLFLHQDTDFLPPSSPVVEHAHKMDFDTVAETLNQEDQLGPMERNIINFFLHSFIDSPPGPTATISATSKEIFNKNLRQDETE